MFLMNEGRIPVVRNGRNLKASPLTSNLAVFVFCMRESIILHGCTVFRQKCSSGFLDHGLIMLVGPQG